MEDMKAVYRLNEEKLDFNTKVLNERASVNLKTGKMLKTRQQRYATIVREVKKAYHKELAEFHRKNLQYTSEFKKFTKQFKELQKKFERFEKSDNNRLKEIWEMNEKEAKEIVEKIMNADKVIHTQQLDIQWKPPSDPIFKQMGQGAAMGADNQSVQGAESNAMNGQSSSMVQQQTTFGDSNNAHSHTEIDHEASQHTDHNGDKAIKYEKIKNVFKLLIDEAEYLIDERAFERCETANIKEQFSIKIDSIRKSLGIENMEDVQLLVDIFYGFEAKFNKEQEARWVKEM